MNKLTSMPKPHAHLQTMYKTPAKFQKDRNEIEGGVALTKYVFPLTSSEVGQNSKLYM